MVKCKDVITFLEQTAPCELAEEWDNVGLMVGNREDNISRIMVCLDITTASIKKAINTKADMIVTHHPVIFKGLKSIIDGENKGSLFYTLIRKGINVYAAHTNLDYAEKGVNVQLAECLGLKSLEELGRGPGKTGILEKASSLEDFILRVKKALDVQYVRVIGKADKSIKKAAVFSGSFDDNLEYIIQSRPDVLVTGDLKYHTALDAVEAGLCIVDAGHFNTEKVILPVLATGLKDKFPEVETFYFKQEEDPFKTY